MGLVNQVGRKRPRARFAMAIVYALLGLGAVTTLYPFLLMVFGGFRGATDQNESALIPRFWTELFPESTSAPDPAAAQTLFGKYLADKYAGDQSQIASTRIGLGQMTKYYEDFLTTLPPETWAAGFRTAPNQVTGRLTMKYQAWLRTRYTNVEDLNRAYVEENSAFQTVQPPSELLERLRWKPPQTRKYREWLVFKRELPAEFRLPIRKERLWQEYLRAKTQNQFDQLPLVLKQRSSEPATSFETLRWSPGFLNFPLPEVRALAQDFESKALPVAFREGGSVEERWEEFTGVRGAMLPIVPYEEAFVRENASPIRSEFTTRNYRYVLDYMAINGRALLNTAIFCLLAILTQLTVNPLAAYAISRYPLKQTGKILIFLLATMAFPAEVAIIPSFLLLKDLGLLNTFAALVLPAAASGYMIFLLKGFFDSLPSELFESGQIDGAKETTMMLRIAFPLSRPVLGYLALLAFMGAYGSFLYAFLVAQDQRIWTIMVFIYQLQNSAPKSVMLAALTLAAVPTLAVFLVAQNVILRGIILPGEK